MKLILCLLVPTISFAQFTPEKKKTALLHENPMEAAVSVKVINGIMMAKIEGYAAQSVFNRMQFTQAKYSKTEDNNLSIVEHTLENQSMKCIKTSATKFFNWNRALSYVKLGSACYWEIGIFNDLPYEKAFKSYE